MSGPLVLDGSPIVTPTEVLIADLTIQDGKIAAIGQDLPERIGSWMPPATSPFPAELIPIAMLNRFTARA